MTIAPLTLVLLGLAMLILVGSGGFLLLRLLRRSDRARIEVLETRLALLSSELDQRTHRHDELLEHDSRFRQIFESLPIGIMILDNRGIFTFVNSAAARMFRSSVEEIVGRRHEPRQVTWRVRQLDGSLLEEADNPFRRVLESGIAISNAEYLFEWFNGATSQYSINAAPILTREGERVGLVASLEDTTDLAQTQKRLVIQTHFFEQMFLQSAIAAQIFDREGNRVRANSEWFRLFEIDETEGAVAPYNIFADQAIIRAGLTTTLRRVIDDGITADWEVLLPTSADDRAPMRWFRITARPITDANSTVANLLVHYQDITQRREFIEQTQASLHEKELLLKEIHHRVKNNMQLMKSILSLQATYVNDPVALGILTDSASRINTMALIHEKLYQGEAFDQIDIHNYLTYVADSIYQTYTRPDLELGMRYHLDPATLDIDTAIPCGLLTNELMNNAMKHAFTGRACGTLEISFSKVPNGPPGDGATPSFELAIADDGVGMPAGFEWEHAGSLGLKLVHSLAGQLGGHVTVTSAPGAGTRISIRFALPDGTLSPPGGVRTS